ncbi:hypothetical protein BGX33_003839 [Mortierella sp. NVP41]|nr:hypothetical protein BGX33_003839 [Mortierella sp. NVP41]
MAPKRSPVDSTIPATNTFFTRGKKPTTTQRIVTAKKSSTTAAAGAPKTYKVRARSDDDEDKVTDEIEDVNTDEEDDNDNTQKVHQQHLQSVAQQKSQDHAHHHHQEEQVDEDEERDEFDDDHEEIEQSDDYDDDDSDTGFGTRGRKMVKTEPIPRPKVTKPTIPKRTTADSASAASKKAGSSQVVTVKVGDILSGFHQADLSDSEKKLRQFDLTMKYGPCTDMTRLERWERAFNLGLHPPQHVKDTLLQHANLNTPLFEGRV